MKLEASECTDYKLLTSYVIKLLSLLCFACFCTRLFELKKKSYLAYF